MNLQNFTESLAHTSPPDVSVYLKSLWYDGNDRWKTAHELIDNLEDKNACWLHAYLHRKERDNWNADYWYSKAGKTRPTESLQEEWKQLVTFFLGQENF